MDIVKVVADSLKVISDRGIEVYEGWFDETSTKTHISIKVLTDETAGVSDDEVDSFVHYIQLNIWSKKDEVKLKREVINLMLKNDFGYDDGNDSYEKKPKVYVKAMRFKYVEDLEI